MSRIRMNTMKYILLGFFTLMVIPVFSNEGQSNSDEPTISVYSGVSSHGIITNVGTRIEYKNILFNVDFINPDTVQIGSELMYKNVSLNLGFSETLEESTGDIGIKVYSSSDINSKDGMFVGLNRHFSNHGWNHNYIPNSYNLGYMHIFNNSKNKMSVELANTIEKEISCSLGYKYTSDDSKNEIDAKVGHNTIEESTGLTKHKNSYNLGYNHTFNSGIYLSSNITGDESGSYVPHFGGLGVGFKFHPSHLNK